MSDRKETRLEIIARLAENMQIPPEDYMACKGMVERTKKDYGSSVKIDPKALDVIAEAATVALSVMEKEERPKVDVVLNNLHVGYLTHLSATHSLKWDDLTRDDKLSCIKHAFTALLYRCGVDQLSDRYTLAELMLASKFEDADL